VSEDEVSETLNKQIWFDTAGFAFPGQIKGLVDGAGVSHSRLLYGSDYPFTKAGGVEMLVKRMNEGVQGLFDEAQIEGLYHGNAEALFALTAGRL